MSMADVFYFSSPRKLPPIAKYRPSLRNKPKATKKRRSANANMFSHQACIARFHEPIFCPSNASTTLFVPGSLLHTTTPTNEIFTPYDLNDDSSEDDEQSGGVPLPPTEDDNEDMMDDIHNVHIVGPSVETPRDTTVASNNNDTESRPLSLTSRPTYNATPVFSTRRPSHPRPETGELREEEDGRRLRLALDGDAPDETPQFATPITMPHRVESQQLSVAADSNTQIHTHTIQSRAPTPNAHSRFRRPPNHDVPQTAPLHHPIAADTESPRQIMAQDQHTTNETPLDDDALAVDDPRRHYDFGDFMDLWRLRSLRDKRLPAFDPGLQSSVRLGRPSEAVTRKQLTSGAVDMQGICWKLVGPSREHASFARAVLHPSGLGTTCFTFKQRSGPSLVANDERHYRFRSFMPQHRAKCTHYQLRNVLAASSRNEIFYATGNKVMSASLTCPSQSWTIMDLSKPSNCAAGFSITCLSASPRPTTAPYLRDNILLAGGFYGEYAVMNLNEPNVPPTEGFVTHAYNGLVTHIHDFPDRRSGLPQALFCSNDRKVRLMDVRNLEFTNTFTYDHAINCAATSVDGRLRVLVGDSQETLITDAERGNPLVTLRDHSDHGFACAWSQDGRYVATAAQDGNTIIWDARKWSKPLRNLNSVMSCARSLNFTDTGALVVAENDDVVRVYKARQFDTWQDIRLFGSIAGVTLLDGGAEIAIANADKTVGGLLSFERTPQGFGNGSYGKHIVEAGDHGSHRWRQGRMLDMSDLISEIVV